MTLDGNKLDTFVESPREQGPAAYYGHVTHRESDEGEAKAGPDDAKGRKNPELHRFGECSSRNPSEVASIEIHGARESNERRYTSNLVTSLELCVNGL